MMYIKTPEIGTESPDPWPPRDWSVSFNAIQLRQDFTGQSDLRAHGYNSGFQGWTMKYLSIDDTEWKSFTTDANGRLFLPNGFEGYLKINMSECPLFSSWTAGGLNPSENYKVDYLEFVFGWVGGEYGSFDIGAFYTLIDDNDSVMLKLDTDLAPVAMGSTAASMEAVTVSDISANEIGAAVDDEIVSITDLGWRPGTTKAVASVGEAVTPISQNKSIVISAEDAEGESPNNASPCVSLHPYAEINPQNNVFMPYIESPDYDKNGWAIRVNSLTYQQEGISDWFYSKFDNADYSYLASDGDGWINSESDGNGTLFLPSGFKGYVKLYLDTAKSWTNASEFNRNEKYHMNSVDFVFNCVGGEYGSFVIGGMYEVVRDCDAVVISLDSGEEVSMTFYIEKMEAALRYDFSSAQPGDDAGLITISDNGYRPGSTQASAVMSEGISLLSANKAMKVSAPVAEGEGPYNATPVVQLDVWTRIHHECNVFMIYIESPQFPSSSESSSAQTNTSDYSDRSEISDGSFTDTKGDTAETEENLSGRKPLRATGSYIPISDSETGSQYSDYTYDIKVTTFNIGGFYHGVSNGIDGSPDYINAEWVPGNLLKWLQDLPRLDADIFALQELSPVFYYDDTKNISISSESLLVKVFKELDTFTGSTANGTQPMYMGLAVNNSSEYSLSDIEQGHLGSKRPASQRAYIKGYVNVKGVDIAVYSVHLGFSDPVAVQDSVNELIALMNRDEYCIVMGDMNSSTIGRTMKNAGMNVANTEEFGNFNTYEYDENSFIDNIFTTPNIKIQYVECEKALAGGSDHYPLSAYLKIDTSAGGGENTNRFETDSDGFISEWYRP